MYIKYVSENAFSVFKPLPLYVIVEYAGLLHAQVWYFIGAIVYNMVVENVSCIKQTLKEKIFIASKQDYSWFKLCSYGNPGIRFI